jgi:ferredoxin-fold anticodon binding domain-containing protein
MNKFQETLEAAKKGTITEQEIKFKVEDTFEAIEEEVRHLKRTKKTAERAISTAIKPDVDPKSWVLGIVNSTVEVKELEIRIAILEGAKKEYFG